MGTRGPAPKRSDQRRRTNSPEAEQAPSGAADGDQLIPAPEDYWHPLAIEWYAALADSGQSAFYETSDWLAAKLLAESIHRELSPQPIVITDENGAKRISMQKLPPKSGTLAAWLKGMTDLMATEGARRRAALELQKPTPATEGQESAGVASIADYRARFG